MPDIATDRLDIPGPAGKPPAAESEVHAGPGLRIERCDCPCANCSGCTGVYVDRTPTCGCGRPRQPGATFCYVCDLPLCEHSGDGCPYACECGCGECEALQARLRGEQEGEHDDGI